MSAVFRSSWLLFSLAVTSLLPAPLLGEEVTERQAAGVSPFRRNTGPAEQTLSASQQFIVHGTDATVRAHVCGVLERLRDDFVHLIDGRASKNDPTTGAPIQEATPGAIDVWIRPGSLPEIRTDAQQIPEAKRVVLSLILAHADLAESTGGRRELVRLLLAERMLRRHPDADLSGQTHWQPDWLVFGVLGAMDYAKSGASNRRFANIVSEGRLLDAAQTLPAVRSELRGPEREAFDVSATGLILALLGQPNGSARFVQFLENSVLSTEDFQQQLTRAFPGLALSRHSLEKWWAIELASLAQPTVFDRFSPAETDRRLAELLEVSHWVPDAPAAKKSGFGQFFTGLFSRKKPAAPPPTPVAATPWPDKPKDGQPDSTDPSGAPAKAPPAPAGHLETIPLAEFERIAKLPDRKTAITGTQLALAELAKLSHPLQEDIFDGYQKILGQLSAGKSKGIAAQLSTLEERRKAVLAQAAEIEDYLDWYQATQRKAHTGTFDSFLRQAEAAEKPKSYRDTISRYLDEVERTLK